MTDVAMSDSRAAVSETFPSPSSSRRKTSVMGRWFTNHMKRYERAIRSRKKILFSNLSTETTPRILELGIGYGPNLRLLPPNVAVVGLDPDKEATPSALKAARRLEERGLQLEVKHGWAEAIPFPDGSFNAVVCTLTLCSVRDPAQVIREIQRVLSPGGKFIFIEHVHAKSGFLRFVQTLLSPFLRPLLNNCHLNRDTESVIREYGVDFETIRVDNFTVELASLGWFIKSQIGGVATKKKCRAMIVQQGRHVF